MHSPELLASGLAFVALVSACHRPPRHRAGQPAPAAMTVPLTPEVPGGYADDPARLALPLRQDLGALALRRREDGRYDLALGTDGGAGPALHDVDLRPFIPRVPRLARGDAALTRIALTQRELNRHETDYGPAAGADDVRVANNCLRQGLWEVILADADGGTRAVRYHGWFTFPAEEYTRLFEEVNGVQYRDYADLLARYPEIGGFPVPLDALRTVTHEVRSGPVATHAGDAVLRLPEQERKAHLLLTPDLRTWGDYYDPARQPVATAKFTEPGYYNRADPMRFDLAWLGQPTGAWVRRVQNVRVPGPLTEVEVDFANGHRLLVGDAELAGLAPRAAPRTEADVRRLTFGIGTPDIYAAAADRAREYADDVPAYVLLLDAAGRHVDNHAAGLDRIYLWRDAEALHLLLVGYERIMLVGDLAVPWPPPPG